MKLGVKQGSSLTCLHVHDVGGGTLEVYDKDIEIYKIKPDKLLVKGPPLDTDIPENIQSVTQAVANENPAYTLTEDDFEKTDMVIEDLMRIYGQNYRFDIIAFGY